MKDIKDSGFLLILNQVYVLLAYIPLNDTTETGMVGWCDGAG